MKKVLVLLVAVFALGMAANAQNALGVRFNGGDGYGAELSGMLGMGGNRVEVDLGWGSSEHHSSFSLTGVYQFTGEIRSGFGWYAGVGGQLTMRSWKDGYGNGNSDFALALVGQLGIEYKFNAIPIQLTLDWRPEFQLIPDTEFFPSCFAFGVRWCF